MELCDAIIYTPWYFDVTLLFTSELSIMSSFLWNKMMYTNDDLCQLMTGADLVDSSYRVPPDFRSVE